MKKEKRYKEGFFFLIGNAVILSIFILAGFLINQIAYSVICGMLVSIGVGVGLERQFNKNCIPLTRGERKAIRKAVLFLIGIGLIIISGYFIF